jgi:hypothetical protein
MKKEKLDILEKVINHWCIDLENGVITTSRGNHGSLNAEGRLVTSATYKGKQYQFYVHQIIAYAGGLNLFDKEVNHIDGDKLNNKFSNLECVTKKENLEHQSENKLYKLPDKKGSNHHNTRLTESDVLKIRELHNNGVSQKKLSEMFGVHTSGINRIIKRINWKHI